MWFFQIEVFQYYGIKLVSYCNIVNKRFKIFKLVIFEKIEKKQICKCHVLKKLEDLFRYHFKDIRI